VKKTEMRSVREITPPEGLIGAQLAEFKILQRALANLEDQWEDLQHGQNPVQQKYTEIFEDEFKSRINQAEIIADLDVQAVEAEYEKEMEKIMASREEDQKNLFKRVVRGYSVSYQKAMSHLKELMGPDFEVFQAANEVEFPQTQSVKNQERKMPQPEEPRITMTHNEAVDQLRKIRHVAAQRSASQD
jgi:hypothetical protein